MAKREIPWERWAYERLSYLEARIRQQRATDDEIAEAGGLRAGLAAGR